MAEPTIEERRFAPGYKIKVGGKELPQEVALDVLEVTVSDFVEGSSTFCVTMNVWTSDGQEYKYIDDDFFKEGTKVEILVGFVDAYESLILGEITALEPDFGNLESPVLRVQGMDLLHRFRRGRRTESFLKMKDSEIVAKVAGRLGLKSDIEDSKVVHDYLLQFNQTDVDFLSERARRIYFELTYDGDTLYFREAANDLKEAVILEYGMTLKTFAPRLTLANQVSEVVVKGWDSLKKEVIEAKSKSGDLVKKMGEKQPGPAASAKAFFESQGVVTDIPVFSQGEAQQIARGRLNDMAIQYITGEGTAIGNTDIRAGRVLKLNKLGKRFSGHYYVRSSTHSVDESGYSTKFWAERNAT